MSGTDDMLAARQAYVLGDGPRIAPLPPADHDEGAQRLIAQMSSINVTLNSRGGLESYEPDAADIAPDDPTRMPEIIPTMAHHPELFSRHTEIGVQLLVHGLLPPRDREIAILRVAWVCQAPYEWGEHVIVAREIGLSTEDIAAVAAGPDAAHWTPHERAILRAVDELRADAMIADATWATLADTYDARRLIELTILIGQYQGVAYYQNSLRLRLHPGNAGLAAR